MGDAVNLAARLMQKAKPGQIVASASILERAETTFECDWLEPFLVKGKSKPIEAAVVGDPIGDRSGTPNAASEAGVVAFVGRTTELELLDRLAVAAIDGRGAVVEITGDAGIGKSRLVREALTRRPELARHAFRGGQYARNSPYFVVRVFLRDVIGVAASDDARSVGDQLRAWIRSTRLNWRSGCHSSPLPSVPTSIRHRKSNASPRSSAAIACSRALLMRSTPRSEGWLRSSPKMSISSTAHPRT